MTRVRLTSWLVGFVAGTTALACSLAVDFDGLTTGGEPDAAATNEAGPDGTSPPDAAPDGRYCDLFAKGPSTFCDDFDDPGRTLVTQGWTAKNTIAGGTLTLVDGGRSAPRALRQRSPAEALTIFRDRLFIPIRTASTRIEPQNS